MVGVERRTAVLRIFELQCYTKASGLVENQ